MLAEWLRRIQRQFRGNSAAAPSLPTARDQWAIKGIHFDTTGWRLTQASEESMTWAGDRGGEMTLTREARASGASRAFDLDIARRQYRARAVRDKGAIVSVEGVVMRDESVALEAITKKPHGRGYSFEGLLSIDDEENEYAVRITAAETMTGIRESVVNAQTWQLGEVNLAEVMQLPAERPTGGRRIPGMFRDPYDSSYDDDALYAASDDPRLDALFPDHPLTIIRAALVRVRTSWVADTPAPASASDRAAASASAGPRVMLSTPALREVYWSAGRNDLLEAELASAIALADPAGDSNDPEVARLLMMLGVAQHNSQNLAQAKATLLRAGSKLTASLGAEHRQTGVALALLGRTEAALGRFLDAERSFGRAIRILDKSADAGLPLLNAIAQYGQILMSQNRMDAALPLVERAQKLLEQRGPAGGLALLRELVGGAPAAVTARTRTIS